MIYEHPSYLMQHFTLHKTSIIWRNRLFNLRLRLILGLTCMTSMSGPRVKEPSGVFPLLACSFSLFLRANVALTSCWEKHSFHT